MASGIALKVKSGMAAISRLLRHPASVVTIPVGLFLVYEAFGETGLIAGAVGLPMLYAATQFWFKSHRRAQKSVGQAMTVAMDQALKAAKTGNRTTGALLLQIDEFDTVLASYTADEVDTIHNSLMTRAKGVLKDADKLLKTGQGRYALIMSPQRRLDMETAIQLASRIQHAVADTIHLPNGSTYITVSIGFCLSNRMKNPTSDEIIQGANVALTEARNHGPAAIRSYSDLMLERIAARRTLHKEMSEAIANQELRAYFQPQISTVTGAITGLEALVRWQHPERGLIPPIEFLPMIEKAGLMRRLTELMVSQSLEALAHWRDRGINIARIGVNFSRDELNNPTLIERLEFELERVNMSAERLAIEVLETVVADNSEDLVIDNLSALAKLGCCIDLDDFGTGHASITSIRRFSVERIKIDRSFVSGIDKNGEQRDMVAAILTMAERLGLETLAEGVETEEERAVLTELGCGHMQGFGIARPMPREETERWITSYNANLLGVTPLHAHHVAG